jgi:hypothetical protein
LLLGVMWTRDVDYRWGLALLLVVSIVSALALAMAQRRSLRPN